MGLVAAAGLWACWIAGWKWSADAREWASWWAPGVALGGASLLSATAWAWARRWALPRALLEADRSLGLKDRLRSGHDLLAGRHVGGEFEAWASQDAERVAMSANASKVVAIRWDRSWLAWPVLASASIAAGLWVPSHEPTVDPRQRATATPEAVQSATELVREAQAIAQASTPLQPILPESVDRTQRELEAIEQELVKGTLDPQEARSRASSAIERQAKELEAQAERLKAERDALRDRMAAAAAQSGEPEPSERTGEEARSTSEASDAVSRLGQRLSSGDFESAANEAEELRRALNEMSPEDREAIAKELDALAERLDRPRDVGPTEPRSSSGEALPSDSRDRENTSAGEDRATSVPESTKTQPERDSAQPMPPGEPEPRDRGEEGRNAAPANPAQTQSEAQRRAEEKAQDVRDALRDAAREAREPVDQNPPPDAGDTRPDSAKPTPSGAERESPQASPAAKGDQEQPSPEQSRSAPSKPQEPGTVSRDAKPNDDKKSPSKDGEEKSPPAASKSSEQGKSEERPGASQKGNESPRDKPAANPGDQSTQKSDGEPKPVPGSDRGVAPGQSQPADGQRTGESGQQAKGESPDSRQGSPTPGSGPPKTPGQDRTPTGDTPEAKPESRPGGESKQDESSGRETTPNPSQTQGQGSPSPTSSSTPQESGPPADVPSSGSSKGQGLERLKRTLEEQASKQREQRQSAEDAERMRQAAQEMLKDMTPEQREKLREMARSGRTPPQGQDGGVPMDVPGARSAREQGVGREAGKQRGGGGEAFKADDPSTKQTETVDARGDRPERSQNSGERVIAEWYSDRPHTGGTARSAGDGLGETVRDAASGAQRAIEQQQVPGRHADLVRRVFRRYVERTSPGATQVAPAPANPGGPR